MGLSLFQTQLCDGRSLCTCVRLDGCDSNMPLVSGENFIFTNCLRLFNYSFVDPNIAELTNVGQCGHKT